MRLACVLVLSVLAAAPARSADDPVAAAKAEAQRLIAGSGWPALFENVTRDDQPAVRHTASGLVCWFHAGAGSRIVVKNKGQDVTCETVLADTPVSVRVMKQKSAPRLDAALGHYTRDLEDARPYAGAVVDLMGSAPATVGAHKTARFDTGGFGASRQFVRVSVAADGDWLVLERASGPGSETLKIDTVGDTVLLATLAELARR